jgi:putative glutamine amidotransferase
MVRRAGGLPVLLTPGPSEQVHDLLGRLDGLVLTGGGDLDPATYGGIAHESVYGVDRERDDFELALARAAAERRFPTLCICRGMQVMNVALGGTLIEDLPSERPGATEHNIAGDEAFRPQHEVNVEPGTTTAKALGCDHLSVNSVHHQALRSVAAGLVVTATAPDGIIEAVAPEDRDWPMWAVQWHPEYRGPDDAPSLGLFQALVDAVQ